MDEQQGTATVLDAGPVAHVGHVQAAGPVAHAGHVQAAEPVAHAEPVFAAGTDRPVCGDEELNQQIIDTFGEFIKHAHDVGQGIAAGFGLTVSDCKALFMLQTPLTMKELGLKMGCDPSFVTSVADALEKHGLARREPSQRDRRSKNLVLTPEGVKVRDLICGELSAKAPWSTALDTSERRCLLQLMRKMLRRGGGR